MRTTSTPTPPARLLLVLATLALALAGCAGQAGEDGDGAAAPAGTTVTLDAGSSDDADEDTEDVAGGEELAAEGGTSTLVAAAVDASSQFRTARMRFSAVTPTPDGDVEVTGEGISDTATGSSSMTMTMGGIAAEAFGTGEAVIDVVLVDGVMYQRFPFLLEQLGSEAEWFSLDLAGMVPGFETVLEQARQLDPSESLAQLRDLTEIEEVGRETAAGVEATHYRGETTIRASMEASGMDDTAMEQLVASSGMDLDAPVPIDVWIDDDGLVRRYDTAVDMEFGTVTSTYEVLEYGIVVDITPPPAEDTVSFEELTSGAQGG